MIDLDCLRRGQLSELANEQIDEWSAIATEQGIPHDSEQLATWCGQRIALFSRGPLARRAAAGPMVDALVEIRRALGLAGVHIVVVPIEIDGVRSMVAEIRDGASCAVLDCSGRKRLGEIKGRSADERALDEAMAICRVRGWPLGRALDLEPV